MHRAAKAADKIAGNGKADLARNTGDRKITAAQQLGAFLNAPASEIVHDRTVQCLPEQAAADIFQFPA